MKIAELAKRDGLPDALKVLLEAYPRQGWTDDPGFDDLIRFWLDRHLMFRRLLGELRLTTEGHIDRRNNAQRFAGMLSRYGGMLVQGLHEHHTIEDSYYFPKLVGHDKRLTAGFNMLDADHHDLDKYLAGFVGVANTALQAAQEDEKLRAATPQVLSSLSDLDGLIDRHLTDEEDLIVPVLLKFGSPT